MGVRRALLGLLAAALLAGAVGAALPEAAAAHAALESSAPAADSSVPASPRRIVLTFSEAPDARLSQVRVLDAQGAVVPDVTDPQVVPGDKLSLEVTPGTPLAVGVYTVNWRAVSSVDGHVESGAFAFGVGQVPAPGSAVVVELQRTSPWASALAAAGRWLLYGALVLLIGAAATSLFAYAGKLPPGGVAVLRGAVTAGVVGLAGMTWAEKVLVGAPSLLPLFVMRQGTLLLGLAVALLLCIGAVLLVDLWPAKWSLWLLAGTGAAAVLVHVVAGHAAAPSWSTLLNIAAQWVHMTAVGVWVGGLFWLLLGFRGRDAAARRAAVGIFTRVATAALIVVLLTGLVRAVAEVGFVSALTGTEYGITLSVKVALVAALVGLGALNHFFWVPAVRAGTDGADRRFRLNSRGELAVALVVLATTAMLTGLSPARAADAGTSGGGVAPTGLTASGHDYATSVRVELTLTPGVAGRNAYTLWVDDYDTGDPLTTVNEVTMKCSLPARQSMTALTVPLRRAADGSWKGEGLDFSVAGRWKMDVYVQERTSGATVPLELTIPAAPAL